MSHFCCSRSLAPSWFTSQAATILPTRAIRVFCWNIRGRRSRTAERPTAAPEPPAQAEPTEPTAPPIPPDETRAALWSDAGLLRDPDRLRALLEDRYPLARLIAASCLARQESRGAHQRVDHPERDPTLDRMHTLVGAGGEPAFERWE